MSTLRGSDGSDVEDRTAPIDSEAAAGTDEGASQQSRPWRVYEGTGRQRDVNPREVSIPHVIITCPGKEFDVDIIQCGQRYEKRVRYHNPAYLMSNVEEWIDEATFVDKAAWSNLRLAAADEALRKPIAQRMAPKPIPEQPDLTEQSEDAGDDEVDPEAEQRRRRYNRKWVLRDFRREFAVQLSEGSEIVAYCSETIIPKHSPDYWMQTALIAGYNATSGKPNWIHCEMSGEDGDLYKRSKPPSEARRIYAKLPHKIGPFEVFGPKGRKKKK